MILEGCIGDTYGAGFEFATREIIVEKNNLTEYIPHPNFKSVFKKYTDDTQMALALTELILEGVDWTPVTIADKFVNVFKRDPREGYASRFYKLLNEVTNGKELLQFIEPQSIRNGAAMRAYPLGILSDLNELKEKSKIQASITHNTHQGIISSEAIALMSFYTFHKKGSLFDLGDFLSYQQGINWSKNWTGEVQIDGLQTVEAVLTILSNHPTTMSEILIQSVDFGGDVDTVASLTMAIASNSQEVENDLPSWLYDDLENGVYGKDYIMSIDEKISSNGGPVFH